MGIQEHQAMSRTERLISALISLDVNIKALRIEIGELRDATKELTVVVSAAPNPVENL